MHLSVLFVISPRLVVWYLAAFPSAEVCIVSCCVPACAPSWCSSSRLLVRSFSPQGFLLSSSLLVFLLVLSFSLSVSRFSPQFFLLGGCISCVVGLRFSPQGFLLFRFSIFLLSNCWALAWICALLIFGGCVFGLPPTRVFAKWLFCGVSVVFGSSLFLYCVRNLFFLFREHVTVHDLPTLSRVDQARRSDSLLANLPVCS